MSLRDYVPGETFPFLLTINELYELISLLGTESDDHEPLAKFSQSVLSRSPPPFIVENGDRLPRQGEETIVMRTQMVLLYTSALTQQRELFALLAYEPNIQWHERIQLTTQHFEHLIANPVVLENPITLQLELGFLLKLVIEMHNHDLLKWLFKFSIYSACIDKNVIVRHTVFDWFVSPSIYALMYGYTESSTLLDKLGRVSVETQFNRLKIRMKAKVKYTSLLYACKIDEETAGPTYTTSIEWFQFIYSILGGDASYFDPTHWVTHDKRQRDPIHIAIRLGNQPIAEFLYHRQPHQFNLYLWSANIVGKSLQFLDNEKLSNNTDTSDLSSEITPPQRTNDTQAITSVSRTSTFPNTPSILHFAAQYSLPHHPNDSRKLWKWLLSIDQVSELLLPHNILPKINNPLKTAIIYGRHIAVILIYQTMLRLYQEKSLGFPEIKPKWFQKMLIKAQQDPNSKAEKVLQFFLSGNCPQRPLFDTNAIFTDSSLKMCLPGLWMDSQINPLATDLYNSLCNKAYALNPLLLAAMFGDHDLVRVLCCPQNLFATTTTQIARTTKISILTFSTAPTTANTLLTNDCAHQDCSCPEQDHTYHIQEDTHKHCSVQSQKDGATNLISSTEIVSQMKIEANMEVKAYDSRNVETNDSTLENTGRSRGANLLCRFYPMLDMFEIDHPTPQGFTPLMIAAVTGWPEQIPWDQNKGDIADWLGYQEHLFDDEFESIQAASGNRDANIDSDEDARDSYTGEFDDGYRDGCASMTIMILAYIESIINGTADQDHYFILQ